ncbi:hypothetical protein [Bacillus seohaeanensis]|jgi:Arc/MetJ-type ribon-helix-helix transcriptional regulator|uniref:Uncharacterized protein n=1 Tax=Bacillus seohaeanensis TaxID=284580 RepID=A0ABW5RX91_9BACI
MLELLDFHKKMYDARWNGELNSNTDFRELEDEFMEIVEREGINLEKANEMLEQLYIPPYKYSLLPEHLKHSRSAKKESAGRPSMGVTKKVSVTLPNDIWDKIQKEIKDQELKSMSAYFRELALESVRKGEKTLKKLLIYKENEEFVIENVNSFNHVFKRKFISEQGLFEGLHSYKPVMDEYELEVSDDLWPVVMNFLNSKEFQG